MAKWSPRFEEALIVLIKDWLKHKGKSQADLGKSLKASSSRMPALLEVLQKDYFVGGLPKVAEKLCEIENHWDEPKEDSIERKVKSDPFNQLDLLLEELQVNCDN